MKDLFKKYFGRNFLAIPALLGVVAFIYSRIGMPPFSIMKKTESVVLLLYAVQAYQMLSKEKETERRIIVIFGIIMLLWDILCLILFNCIMYGSVL